MASCCLLSTEIDGCVQDCTVYVTEVTKLVIRLHNRTGLLLINSFFLVHIYALSLSQFVSHFSRYLSLCTTYCIVTL